MVKIPDILTSGGEEEHVRGAKMHPLTVVGGIGQRLVSAANLLLESSAGASSGCGFSLSRPREGRQLPSDRDANGGILAWIWRVDRGLVKFFLTFAFLLRIFAEYRRGDLSRRCLW